MTWLTSYTTCVDVTLAAATWALVVIAGRRAQPVAGRPEERLLVARAWLLAPLWVPALLVLAAMAPGVVGSLVERGDHCLLHGGHHHHLCLLHPPHAADTAVGWLVTLALVLPALLLFALCLRRVRVDARLAAALVATSRPSTLGPDVRVLDQAAPLALTVGWRRPTVLLSEGLLARLSPAGLAVVLAHERAHVARGDTRHALIDRLAGSLYPRAVAAHLLGVITLGREQACDAAAARRAGGPVAVAAALTEILRLGLRPPAVGVSVASSAVEARVLSLLAPAPPRRRWGWLLVGVIAALAVGGAGPVHTAIERLVTFLLH
ncbi:MAG: M48 family metalloprotease [Myxococcales bacterium]|nr:M48 family metalloprotease [Myxococcales bacterium]